MAKTNDELMQELLRAKRNGEKIYYGCKGGTLPNIVENDHEWNLTDNMYVIRHRREYIIKIDDRDKDNPAIEYTDNHWTRSDFGKTEMGEYVLMREVYPEEM